LLGLNLNVEVVVGTTGKIQNTTAVHHLASPSVHMIDPNVISFALGLVAGLALFGVMLGTIWKRL
jgi:hypothetical protein